MHVLANYFYRNNIKVGYPTNDWSDIMEFIEYNAKLDTKRRLSIRGAKYDYYNVKEYDNGLILLEPRELTKPLEISENTLKMMDEAISNIKAGKVSNPTKI